MWPFPDEPAPPPPSSIDWTSTTLETKLILTLIIVLLLLATTSSQFTGNGHASTAASHSSVPILHGAAAVLLFLLFSSPGTLDALRLFLWSPIKLLDVPPGIVLIVLGAALVLAVSFTSTIYKSQQTATPPSSPPSSPTPGRNKLPSAAATSQLIASRRSVFPKDYTGAAVPRDAIERALGAANWAPTHGKTEPWRFVVFHGPQAIARFEALKVSATTRSLSSNPDKLAAALQKIERKGKDVSKCAAVVAIILKRLPNAKGELMPEWEDMCAVACAVQNLHLQLTAEGYCGYWSSGGVGGWADDPEVKELVVGGNASSSSGDRLLGWFHIGASEAAERYKAKRQPIASKVTWIDGS